MEWRTRLESWFELARGGESHNVKTMEGLRGFAVFLVFLVHYTTLASPWIAGSPNLETFGRKIHTIGNVGVDLFFVLSGFLIYGTLISRKQEFSRFMFRRIQRIYPTFLVVFAAYVGLSFVFPAESKLPASQAAAAIYIAQNLLLMPGMFRIEPLITVAWSLSYEMFYYLSIPLLIGLFNLRERSPRWRTTFFLLLAFSYSIFSTLFGGHPRLVMFVAGIALYEALNNPDLPAPGGYWGMAALVSGLASTLISSSGGLESTIKTWALFLSFWLVCLSCFRSSKSSFAELFAWLPLRWLGNMSYSYYLIHGLTLKAIFLLASKTLPIEPFGNAIFWALLPFSFMLTLATGAVLFIFVERPFSLEAGSSAKQVASRAQAKS